MGDQLDEEATAICDKIVKAQDRIKELEAEIEQVKADREAEKRNGQSRNVWKQKLRHRRQQKGLPRKRRKQPVMYRSPMRTAKWADSAAAAAHLWQKDKSSAALAESLLMM